MVEVREVSGTKERKLGLVMSELLGEIGGLGGRGRKKWDYSGTGAALKKKSLRGESRKPFPSMVDPKGKSLNQLIAKRPHRKVHSNFVDHQNSVDEFPPPIMG